MFITTLLTCIIIPVLITVMGGIIMNNPPKNRLGSFGYRTERSRRSGEAWRFANKMAGRIWFYEGFALIALSIAGVYLMRNSDEMGFTITIIVTLVIQAVLISVPVIFVEKALKDKFGS